MKARLIETTFTAAIVALIILPLPPSTIIGVALATHPKTGKYMNPHAYKATMWVMSMIGAVTVRPVVKASLVVASGKEKSAASRIALGSVRL